MMAMNPSRIQRPIRRPGELGFRGAFFFLFVDPGFGTLIPNGTTNHFKVQQ
jgi:hypothetical protein